MLSEFFRAMPLFKGKTRLGRLCFGNAIKNDLNIKVAGKFGCTYVLPNLSEILALDIFLSGIYEPDTNEFLVDTIPQNATVLDIGANIGSICIPLAKRRSDLRFVCIEASPFVFKYLQENIRMNALESRVFCINKALSDKDDISLPFYSDPGNFGKGSLSPVFTSQPVMVQTITIDKLLSDLQIGSVNFIKADIEGYEYFAFMGGKELLQKTDGPPVFFEFVDWAEQCAKLPPGAAQKLLMSFGYELYIYKNNRMNKLGTIMEKKSAMLYARKQ
jgi:FkbM family methyltransferase